MTKLISRAVTITTIAALVLMGCGDNWIKGGESTGVNEFLGWFGEGSGGLGEECRDNEYSVTIKAEPANGGTVVPSGTACYSPGMVVNVTAAPNQGYYWGRWTVTGGAVGDTSSETTTATVNSVMTITANFRQHGIPTPSDTGRFTDSRDGRTYRYVRIGNQRWMAENLNYAGPSGNLGVCYNNAPDSCAKYGRLYSWDEALTACPAGWHLPTDAEWTILTDYVDGVSTVGTKLKSTTGWNTGSGYIPGTNDYGFSALPGGGRWGGSFNHAGDNGIWWSATELDATIAGGRGMGSYYDDVDAGWNDKAYGFSLRCLAD